jgi:hypothetical protein
MGNLYNKLNDKFNNSPVHSFFLPNFVLIAKEDWGKFLPNTNTRV